MPVARINDSYRNFRFLVEIDSIVRAGFSEATMPNSTCNLIEYREGNEAPHARKLPELPKHGALTLKRGIIDFTELYNYASRWNRGK